MNPQLDVVRHRLPRNRLKQLTGKQSQRPSPALTPEAPSTFPGSSDINKGKIASLKNSLPFDQPSQSITSSSQGVSAPPQVLQQV